MTTIDGREVINHKWKWEGKLQKCRCCGVVSKFDSGRWYLMETEIFVGKTILHHFASEVVQPLKVWSNHRPNCVEHS